MVLGAHSLTERLAACGVRRCDPCDDGAGRSGLPLLRRAVSRRKLREVELRFGVSQALAGVLRRASLGALCTRTHWRSPKSARIGLPARSMPSARTLVSVGDG